MKSKNIPKCIREGIFCFMTGAFVFAGSAITAQAAEGDGGADLPQENDISRDLDNGTDSVAEDAADQVVNQATDDNYGEQTSGESYTETNSEGDVTQTDVATYQETGDNNTFTSETTVTTETTEYNTDNFNKVEDSSQSTVVKNGPAEEATLVDSKGNPIKDSKGNEITSTVTNYTETTTQGHYEDPDNAGTWAPYEESTTTQETTVTTDNRDVAEGIKAGIEAEIVNGGESTVKDNKGNVIHATTVSVSDISVAASIDGTDVTGMGVNEGDSFKVTTASDGTITITKTDAAGKSTTVEADSDLYKIVNKASEGKEKTYYIEGSETEVDGNHTYTVTKNVDESGNETVSVTDENGNEITSDQIRATVLNNTNATINYVVTGTNVGVDGTHTYTVSKNVSSSGKETTVIKDEKGNIIDNSSDVGKAILANTNVTLKYVINGTTQEVDGEHTYTVTVVADTDAEGKIQYNEDGSIKTKKIVKDENNTE
ncbi:MAG: hypothetical protein IJ058_09705, partial [Lachnospiraceae bacterium]|nr:hypothetical protein [Lachnospiraceae bacterium]